MKNLNIDIKNCKLKTKLQNKNTVPDGVVAIPVISDIVQTFYLQTRPEELNLPEGQMLNVLVTDKVMNELLHTTPEAMTEQAEHNYCLMDMPSFPGIESAVPMFVVTSKDLTNGAAAIMDENIREEIDRRYPEGVFLIPSSVHEFIAVPKLNDIMQVKEIKELICSVNNDATVVEPKDILSYELFFMKNKELSVAEA